MIVPSIFHLLAAAWLFASQGWFISGSRQDQVDVDLDLGVVTGYSERVQFLTSPSPKTHKAKCSRQAVIKVELGGALQVAQLVLKYSNPKLWTLHISDSSLAEGYGSLQNSSATTEIEVINQQLRIYSEWPPPNTVVSMRDSDGTGTTHSQWMFLRVVDETVRKHTQMELTMNLRSNSFRWQDGRLTQDFPAPPGLFYQHDAQKNKVTVYIAMNRIISGNWRSGSGLCHLTLKLMDKEEECNTSLMGCDPNAVCKLTRRGYRCSCKKGWQGNGKICKDINECVVRDGGCVHNCHNTPGSYRCSCHSGFKADPDDNHNCLDIDECVVNKGGCEEDCINTIGSYECRCSKDGYFFGTNQKHCRSGNAACSAHGCHQTCELAHNMRLKSCSCWPGYHINATDGKSCMRTCRLGNGGCHHHCLDTETGPICTCHHTYLLGLDVHSCAASCAVNNGGCQKRCMNTNIGVICSCPSGYNLNANGKSCEDIDECAISNGGCENQCVNNIGSYECICPSGYKLNPSDEKTCVDIDECELNHTCEHICVNTPGSYRCECHRGYKLYGISHCGDIDECSIGNGGCPHICINDNGGYHCSTIDENKILTYSTECVGSYIASSKYLIIGLASERNNILKLFGEQFILKFKELGINECDIHIQRMHNVNAKRIYRKYGVAEGKPLQVTLDVICKTVNVTNSCDQQCAITNASQALCKALSLMRKALSGSFYVIVENKNLSAIPRSFSVQQMYTSPCHTKGERKRIKDICLEPKKAGSLTQVVRKIDGKLEARLSALSRGTARNIDDCSAGTYWEEVKKTCELCMKNTYQQKSGQKYCLKCPGNSQTDGEGATSVDDCKDRRCKNYINELSGFIESPNYPGPYPSNSDCTWILKPPKRRRLLIIVPEIDLAGDKCEDYLVMRKSRSPYSTVTFEACKSIKKPIAFTAQSRTLWMHFQSDSYNNSKGFHIPFVTYNEEYQSLIEDIVQDSRLYASHNHLEILRDQKLLGALMEVIAQPINYYKYENEQRKMFPSSFIRFVTPKVRKFFSYRR